MSDSSTRRKPSVLVHFVAGGVGGTCGAALTCPLEVVKTRLQSSLYRASEADNGVSMFRNPVRAVYTHCRGVVRLLTTIAEQEGFTALWKGLGPNLLGVVPARAIYFTVYSQGKHFYSGLNGGVESPIVHMASAASAGTAVASFTNPIWLIKTRMQLQSSELRHSNTHSTTVASSVATSANTATVPITTNAGTVRSVADTTTTTSTTTNVTGTKPVARYRNSFHCFVTVVREEGIRGLYRGWSASLLGLVESSLQFMAYEFLKKEFYNARLAEARRKVLSADTPLPIPTQGETRHTRERTNVIDDMSDEELGAPGSLVSSGLKQYQEDRARREAAAASLKIELGFLDTFVAAATAKLGAALLTYPHEVLRTRMRQTPVDGKTKYERLIPTLTTIYKEEGVAALYGGMTAHLMRVVPNAAILFFCYEMVVQALNNAGFNDEVKR